MSVLKYYDEKSKAYRSLPLGCESVAVANWNYSTDEQVIGCWYDGRPIYRRIYNLGTNFAISTSQQSLSSKITDNNFLAIVRGNYLIVDISEDAIVSVPTEVRATKTVILTRASQSWSAQSTRTILLYLEYTKTTDTENSFSIDMLSSGDLDTTATDEEVAAVFS